MSKALVFKYSAITHDSRTVHGVLPADSFELARDQLLNQFRHLLDLKESRLLSLKALWPQRIPTAELALYVRRVATMMDAGVTFANSFSFVAEGECEDLNKVFEQVALDLRTGMAVSRALSHHPQAFNQLFLAMVCSGERSGGLHLAFHKMADLLERQTNLQRRMMAAVSYPLVVSAISTLVFSMFLFWVVPMLVPMFAQVDAQLPTLTLAMLALAEFIKHPLTWGAGLFIFGVALPAFIHYAYVQGQLPRLRYAVDEWMLKIPVVSRLAELAVVSRMMDTLSTLINAGLPVIEAVKTAADVSANSVFKSRLLGALDFLRDGRSLSFCFERCQLFSPMVLSMVELGEESGKLPFLLRKTSELLREDLEIELNRLVLLVEPALMMITGTAVGLIVLASFLPMIQLVQAF